MQRALDIDPMSHNFLADMGQMHYFAGEYTEAQSYCKKALEIYPDFIWARDYLSRVYLREMHKRAAGFSHVAALHSHALLGEKEKALEYLEKSYENHEFLLPFVNVDPFFDDLRSDPRFQAVFRRMGLAN